MNSLTFNGDCPSVTQSQSGVSKSKRCQHYMAVCKICNTKLQAAAKELLDVLCIQHDASVNPSSTINNLP